MDRALNSILNQVDMLRGSVLSRTLQFPFLRSLFYDRASRLLVFFLLACLIYLPLSLYFPVWIAILGPIMYGVPHIASSLRYTGFNLSIPLKGFFIGVWIFITFFRIATDHLALDYGSFMVHDVELLSWGISLCLLWFVGGRNGSSFLKGAALLSVMVYFAWKAPLAATAFLLLAHNFIAFVYWIMSSTTRKELYVSVVATVIFSILSICIVTGALDFMLKIFSAQGYVAFFDMDYKDLGKSLAPWSDDYQVWYRYFVAYVFGQSLHYFVWLKAVPDLHLKGESPVSFKMSYRFLKQDFGRGLLILIGVACVATAGIWFFFNMQEARLIYFAIASFHGFHEFSGLTFHKGALGV